MPSYKVFIPPSRHTVPPVGAETPPEDYAPAIYFNDPIRAGENVFLTTGGVVTEAQPEVWELVKTVWWGGHINTITDAEAAILTAAGYGANIQTVVTGTDPVPPPVIPPVLPGSGWGVGGWGTEGWGT
jgi:hypothetical protein